MKKGQFKAQISEEDLRHQYLVLGLSARTIARELGVSDWWVGTRLRQYGIKTIHKGSRFKINILGHRFGSYTVIDTAVSRGSNTYWSVRCDCGSVNEVESGGLRNGSISSCGKCGNHHLWTGVGKLSGQYFCAIRAGAKARKLSFNITKEYIWELFEKQGGLCSLTGLPITFVKSYGTDSSFQTASLDRVDNNVGYEPGNVRWLHKAVNIMRWNMSDETLIQWCKKVVDYHDASNIKEINEEI